MGVAFVIGVHVSVQCANASVLTAFPTAGAQFTRFSSMGFHIARGGGAGVDNSYATYWQVAELSSYTVLYLRNHSIKIRCPNVPNLPEMRN